MLLRRVAAVFLGLLVFLLLTVWGLFVGWMNADLVHPMDTIGGLIEQGYQETDIYYLKDNDALAIIGFAILAFAGGLVAAILTLTTKMKLGLRLAFVMLGLLLLVPLSAANFHSQDQFSLRSVQAAINIPMILLGTFSLFYFL